MGHWIAVGGTMDCCWWDNGLLLVGPTGLYGTMDCSVFDLKTSGSSLGLRTTRSSSSQTGSGLG